MSMSMCEKRGQLTALFGAVFALTLLSTWTFWGLKALFAASIAVLLAFWVNNVVNSIALNGGLNAMAIKSSLYVRNLV